MTGIDLRKITALMRKPSRWQASTWERYQLYQRNLHDDAVGLRKILALLTKPPRWQASTWERYQLYWRNLHDDAVGLRKIPTLPTKPARWQASAWERYQCRVLSLSDCRYSLNPLNQTRIDWVGRYRIRWTFKLSYTWRVRVVIIGVLLRIKYLLTNN